MRIPTPSSTRACSTFAPPAARNRSSGSTGRRTGNVALAGPAKRSPSTKRENASGQARPSLIRTRRTGSWVRFREEMPATAPQSDDAQGSRQSKGGPDNNADAHALVEVRTTAPDGSSGSRESATFNRSRQRGPQGKRTEGSPGFRGPTGAQGLVDIGAILVRLDPPQIEKTAIAGPVLTSPWRTRRSLPFRNPPQQHTAVRVGIDEHLSLAASRLNCSS